MQREQTDYIPFHERGGTWIIIFGLVGAALLWKWLDRKPEPVTPVATPVNNVVPDKRFIDVSERPAAPQTIIVNNVINPTEVRTTERIIERPFETVRIVRQPVVVERVVEKPVVVRVQDDCEPGRIEHEKRVTEWMGYFKK